MSFIFTTDDSLVVVGAICVTVGTLVMLSGSYLTGVGHYFHAASVGATGSFFLLLLCTTRYWRLSIIWQPVVPAPGGPLNVTFVLPQFPISNVIRFILFNHPAYTTCYLFLFYTVASLLGHSICELTRHPRPMFSRNDAFYMSLRGTTVISIPIVLLSLGAQALNHTIPIFLRSIRSFRAWILTLPSLMAALILWVALSVVNMTCFMLLTLSWMMSKLFSLSVMVIEALFLISRRYTGATEVIRYTAAGAVFLSMSIAINCDAVIPHALFIGAIIQSIREYPQVSGSGLN